MCRYRSHLCCFVANWISIGRMGSDCVYVFQQELKTQTEAPPIHMLVRVVDSTTKHREQKRSKNERQV